MTRHRIRSHRKTPEKKQVKKRNSKNETKRAKYNKHHLNPRSKIPELKSKILKIIEDERKNSFFSSTERLLYSMLKQGELPHRGIERILRQTKRVLLTIHEAWNKIFGGDTYAWDAIKKVENFAKLGLDTFTEDQKQAWNLLFGHSATISEVIDIIKDRWSPDFPPIEMMIKVIRRERKCTK